MRAKPLIYNSLLALTSLLFFYLQLNVAIKAALGQVPLITAALCLCCFKTGELLHEVFDIQYHPLFTLIWVSAFVGSQFFLGQWWLYLIFSYFMMSCRATLLTVSAKKYKVLGRAVGFVISPISCSTILSLSAIALGLFCLIAVPAKRLHAQVFLPFANRSFPKNKYAYLAMSVHHFHYFAYCYSIPILVTRTSNVSPLCIGLIFYLGWSAYNAYERFIKPSYLWIISGHIVAAGALLWMYFDHGLFSLLIGWFLTGLGGGTVYMIPSLLRPPLEFTKQDMAVAEGIGHITGMVTWLFFAVYYSDYSPLLVGAFGAIATIPIVYKAKKQLTSRDRESDVRI